jgi:hypothetical protein
MQYGIPNSQCVAALEKDVGRCFRFPLAKFAIATIRPPSLLESIIRSITVLQDDPCKELAFRWSQVFHTASIM